MPELPPKVETLVIITTLNEQLCVTCPGLEIKLLNNKQILSDKQVNSCHR